MNLSFRHLLLLGANLLALTSAARAASGSLSGSVTNAALRNALSGATVELQSTLQQREHLKPLPDPIPLKDPPENPVSYRSATNRWLADALAMGSPFQVSRLASACRAAPGSAEPFLRAIAKTRA